MTTFANLEQIAAHLHVGVIDGEPPRIAWRRSPSSAVVDIYWDDARGVVWIRAPLAIDTTRFDQRELALAIAAINIKLELFGVEYDAEPTFVSHVFLDADGNVSQRAIDRLLLAVDQCAAQTAAVVAGLAPREGHV